MSPFVRNQSFTGNLSLYFQTINLRHISFNNGDMARYRMLKKQVEKELKIVNYKERVEKQKLSWLGKGLSP